MPGMNAVGTNTAARMSAIATTGPETSSIALRRRVPRRQPFLDVVLDRLDHDDGIVDDETDRQHQPEERQSVDREAQQRKDGERSDQRHRHGQQRNQRRPPALQKDEDDEDHQGERLEERL